MESQQQMEMAFSRLIAWQICLMTYLRLINPAELWCISNMEGD